ncbi:hypothetical protein PGT21_023609 [Puccinia graminis f. sp. tritici]|uniref:Uncharacterized protein n=1 Tax=Puccinia graminis f. sp. tritici TaxID=56615 RepID=A0A5B0LU80_PUCGR|nr:hypothetical protein PGT21_023609 [Puccinia graminis f. sp. tritici]
MYTFAIAVITTGSLVQVDALKTIHRCTQDTSSAPKNSWTILPHPKLEREL